MNQSIKEKVRNKLPKCMKFLNNKQYIRSIKLEIIVILIDWNDLIRVVTFSAYKIQTKMLNSRRRSEQIRETWIKSWRLCLNKSSAIKVWSFLAGMTSLEIFRGTCLMWEIYSIGNGNHRKVPYRNLKTQTDKKNDALSHYWHHDWNQD